MQKAMWYLLDDLLSKESSHMIGSGSNACYVELSMDIFCCDVINLFCASCLAVETHFCELKKKNEA